MSTWQTLWIALAGVVALSWLLRFRIMTRACRRRRVLSSRSSLEPVADPPRLSAVVAAKDEENNIESCINSLLAQDYPNMEVIAVDDRSTDRTPEILARLEGGAGGQLRVITVRSLRAGWFGKNNAMREGVEAATGEWFCFTDADCQQTSQNSMTVAMSRARTDGADFLSITPRLEATTTWEKIVQPVCALVLMAWFLPNRVNKPSRKTAYANGAFMLMRRSCYERIGGHERVRTKVNEDIHMARFAKQSGQRLLVYENEDLYRVRMYESAADAWRGWSRIYYGCLETLPRLMLSALLLSVCSILPWVAVPTCLVAAWFAEPGRSAPWLMVAGAWLGALMLQWLVTWRFFGMLGIARRWSLAYALGAVAVLTMLLNAMLKVVGVSGITWRGTTYRGDRHVPGPPTEKQVTPTETQYPVRYTQKGDSRVFER